MNRLVGAGLISPEIALGHNRLNVGNTSNKVFQVKDTSAVEPIESISCQDARGDQPIDQERVEGSLWWLVYHEYKKVSDTSGVQSVRHF